MGDSEALVPAKPVQNRVLRITELSGDLTCLVDGDFSEASSAFAGCLPIPPFTPKADASFWSAAHSSHAGSVGWC